MTRAAVLLVAAVAALPACEEVTPAARGFGSRQLTTLRDPTFEFAGARGDLILYWTGDAPATTRYWSVDVTTGAVREHDPVFSDVPVPQYTIPADPNARFHCSYGTGGDGAVTGRYADRRRADRSAHDDRRPRAGGRVSKRSRPDHQALAAATPAAT